MSQVSDLMMIQTSVQSPKVYRNVVLILGILTSFIGVQILSQIFKDRLEKIKLPAVIFFLTIGLILLAGLTPRPKIRKYKISVINSLFYTPTRLGELINSPLLKDIKESDYYKPPLTTTTLTKKHNVVFVVMETLASKALPNNLQEVMPNFYGLKDASWSFENHYTSWPFSSKSLYSIVCGRINYPSDVIEMRVLAKFKCNSWVQTLLKESYDGGVYYTGDLHYDNMGKFFGSIGLDSLEDKRTLNSLGKYEANSLSIDDQSMVDSFNDYLKAKPQAPFIKFFITMNSHHPFWAPSSYKKFKDPYLNSISYQDQILGNIIQSLKKNGKYDDSIIIITGDHGKREASANKEYIAESMFKIPLLIKLPNQSSKTILTPSAHYQIGETLLGYLGDNLSPKTGLFKEEAFLFFGTDKFYYYLFSGTDHYLFDGDSVYKDSEWVNSNSEKSEDVQILSGFRYYFKGLHETYR